MIQLELISLQPARIRRHFLGWDRPWLATVTAWLGGEWTGKGPLDLTSVLVIVPTQQAGRRLREALASFAAEKGAAVFAPRVLTPEALMKQDVAGAAASPLAALLAWVDVLRTTELEQFRTVFPVDPPARSFTWALRVAQQLVRLQIALGEVGLRVEDVAPAAGEEFVERERWQELAALAQLQASRLRSRQLEEPHAARIRAAKRPAFELGFERIVLLGVPDLPPLVEQRLARVAESRAIELAIAAPESEGEHFDSWGRPTRAHWNRRVLEIPEFDQRVHLCADPGDQAARLTELVQQYGAAASVLAVGIADPEIIPLLENELARVERAAFNPDGHPIRREGLFVLLNCLAEVAREPTFTAVAELARCPDFIGFLQATHGSGFSAARWLEALDNLHASHLPADLRGALAFATRSGFPSELKAGLQTMERVRSDLETADFISGLTQVLRQLFSTREIDRTKREDERFEQAAKAWMAAIVDISAIRETSAPLENREVWELMLRVVGEQRIVDEKAPGALELQGWLELLWEDARHLVVAGVNEGAIPEAVPEDPFLPGMLRERLGMVTNAQRSARDAYLLTAVAASRRTNGRLDLLFGKTSAAGEPIRPSRLLLRCPDAELPRRVAALFRSPDLPERNAAWSRAWTLKPRRVDPPARVAVTGLRRYLACPFRFYLRTVLGMDSVDPLKTELDAFDFGILCHSSLEQLAIDPALRNCTDGGALRATLIGHLDRVVEQRYGALHSLPMIVQVESARQRLGKFAELQAASRAEGWETLEVERPFHVEIAGLVVRGKIDRIDRHATTGAIRVLDYKTSDTPVTPAEAHLRNIRPGEELPAWKQVEIESRPRAWADLQLPLYLQALRAELGPNMTCGYFNLPKAAGETTLALWEDYTPALHESAMRCAEGACAAIRRGDFWPPNETIRADRDECAMLFHHGVEPSVTWGKA